ncbi:hypothetical protein ACJMK2_001795, partial [Sinanodonta woodiana]
ISSTPSDVAQFSPNGNSQKKSLDVNSFPVQENDFDLVRVTTRRQKAQTKADLKPTQCVVMGWSSDEIRQDQLEDPNIAPIMVPAEEGS